MDSNLILGIAYSIFTRFLSHFVEATPFLLLGVIGSGLVEALISKVGLTRMAPHSIVAATLIGTVLGLALPVGEAGAVPMARRLTSKGLPAPAGIAFLLSAPIVNPVAIATTIAAFGPGPIALSRIALGATISFVVGLIFAFDKSSSAVIRATNLTDVIDAPSETMIEPTAHAFGSRLTQALRVAGEEFFEFGPYLVAGCLLAALVQTALPIQMLTQFGAGVLSSPVALSLLAFAQSTNSAFDAFGAIGLTTSFTTGSIIAYLVFGSMVDIKRLGLLLRVYKGKMVVYLTILTALLSILAAVFINVWLSW